MLERILALPARFIEWRRKSAEWAEEHERTWPPAFKKQASGLNAFQELCESAVVKALLSEGLSLRDRKIEGKSEKFVLAVIAGPDWAIGIYEDGADIWKEPATLVRLEDWDTKSPDEFVKMFVDQMLVHVREWKKGSA